MSTSPDLQQRLQRLTPAQRAELLQKLRHSSPNGDAPSTIQPVSRQARLPLSFSQQRLWFLDQLTEGSALYNIPLAVRLHGELNLSVLENSLCAVIQRHEVLRTVFPSPSSTGTDEHDAAQQIILPTSDFQLHFVDLQGELDGMATVRAQAAVEAQRPFALTTGPLLRATLLRLAMDDHVLLLTMHHIVSDGWSMGVLVQEAGNLYAAAMRGEKANLPPLPIQYADFAHWQRHTFGGEALEQQLAYWQKQLADIPPLLELPTDHPRPDVQRYGGAQQITHIAQPLAEQLSALGNQVNATPFMTLLAAFATLLMRHSGQEDVVIGSPIAGRNRKELEPLIGFFVNTLVLRSDLTNNPSFLALLKQVRQMALDAYKQQDVPFDLLVERLQPARTLRYSPLFQVMFVLQNAPVGNMTVPLANGQLNMTPLALGTVSARFDLTLEVTPSADGLTCVWTYNRDLFEAATITRLTDHFASLLAALVAEPSQPVAQLPMLTAGEQQQLLHDWNETDVEYPTLQCIHHWFEQQVAQQPTALAAIYEDQPLTYAELNQCANQLAHYLQGLGVGPESAVGLCVERSLEMIIGLLGILKAGAAYLPLDPRLPEDRLTFILQEAQARVVVTQQHLMPTLPHTVQGLALDGDWAAQRAAYSAANPISAVTPENLVYIIFTSGSTGNPKGVAVEHRQLYNYVCGVQRALELPAGSSFATVSTLAADLGNTAIFPTLCQGGALVVISQERLTDADAFAAYLQQQPVDCLKITPSHLQALLSAAHPAHVLPRQRLILGGEASSWELIAQVQQLAPACRIFNHYGPTETTVGVLTYPLTTPLQRAPANTVPLGRPIGNTQVYILDRHGQPTPPGVPGELYIGGQSVARGYLNRPDLTAERFVTTSHANSRLYRTGDLVRYLPATDGANPAIEFLGRIDQQVKIRGFRVELGEIEAVLRQHPLVDQALVIARQEQGDQQIVAYVVLAASLEQAEQAASHGQLRQFLQTRLPDYMLPAAILFLPALPLTANGKIDRRALPAPSSDSLSAPHRNGTVYVAPRNTTEQTLATIWAELLRLPQIGIDDNFFACGGHSLLAIQLITRLRSAFGREVAVRWLFEAPTIATFAPLLDKAEAEIMPPAAKQPTTINRVARDQYRARRPADTKNAM